MMARSSIASKLGVLTARDLNFKNMEAIFFSFYRLRRKCA